MERLGGLAIELVGGLANAPPSHRRRQVNNVSLPALFMALQQGNAVTFQN